MVKTIYLGLRYLSGIEDVSVVKGISLGLRGCL